MNVRLLNRRPNGSATLPNRKLLLNDRSLNGVLKQDSNKKKSISERNSSKIMLIAWQMYSSKKGFVVPSRWLKFALLLGLARLPHFSVWILSARQRFSGFYMNLVCWGL